LSKYIRVRAQLRPVGVNTMLYVVA